VLVVGTGASGLMKVLPEVRQVAEAQGIELIWRLPIRLAIPITSFVVPGGQWRRYILPAE